MADIPEISGLTKDELLQLDNEIHLALFDEALLNGVLVPQGKYIVGDEIPAGVYRADIVSNTGGSITVYKSKNSKEKLVDMLLGKMWGTLVFKLEVEDGNYIVLEYNSVILSPYKGLADLSEKRK